MLYPDSPGWWQYLDSLGIDGDNLLSPYAVSDSKQQQRRTVLQVEGVQEKETTSKGAHWEVAKQLLSRFQPMEDTNCPLFARKFAADDAENIAALAKEFTDPRLVLAAVNASDTRQNSSLL